MPTHTETESHPGVTTAEQSELHHTIESQVIYYLKESEFSDVQHTPFLLYGVTPELFDDFLSTETGAKIAGFYSTSHASVTYNSLNHTLRIRTNAAPMHDDIAWWLTSSIYRSPILEPVMNRIRIGSRQTFAGFAPPYEYSQKQPDWFIMVGKRYWPNVVMEIGWSELYATLLEDIKLWVLGGRATASTKLFGDGRELGTVDVGILATFDHLDLDPDNASSFVGRIETWKRKEGKDDEIEKTSEAVWCSSTPYLKFFFLLRPLWAW